MPTTDKKIYKKNKIKIIAIINETTVIINAGTREGIKKDDKFNILDKKVYKLTDPDTHEVLDTFKKYKQKLYVKELHETYCICVSTYKKHIMPASSLALMKSLTEPLNPFLKQDKESVKIIGKKMKIDPKEINDILSSYSYSTVHVGDVVKII